MNTEPDNSADPTPTVDRPTLALVLGSGGTAGGAFHAGVLKALHDVWNIDPRDAHTIIGTSAGALTGALVAAGMSADDIFRRETGKPLSSEGAELLNMARARIGERRTARSSMGVPAAPEILSHVLLRPWGVSPATVAAALLPRGTVPTSAVEGLTSGLLDGRWPASPRLRVCAVEMTTGRRVVFDETSQVLPSLAIAASCAVPGVFVPVTIDGREYFDGATHSSDNLDVLRHEQPRIVLVSSPMSTDRVANRPGPWSGLRAATRVQTSQERRRLGRNMRVEIIRPSADDLDAMGSNMLDPRRRPAVAMQAYSTASEILRRLDPPELTHAGHQ